MLEFSVHAEGRARLVGRMDAAECRRVRAAFAEVRGPLSVDCSGLDYISSAGLALLVETHQRLAAAGHDLRLTGVVPRVRDVFTYAGLDQLIELG